MANVRKSLGESLVDEGMITAGQLQQAREEEKHGGERLNKILVRLGFIDEETLVSFINDKLGVPMIELTNFLIDPKLSELIPEELARKHELVPVLKIGDRLTCAMSDPWNIFALDEIRSKTGLTVEPSIATDTEIRKALNECYGAQGSMDELIKSIDENKIGIEAGKDPDVGTLQMIAGEPVVTKLVNLIIRQAIQEGASDIHIEPEETLLGMRLRMDGMLHEISSLPKHLQSPIISRVKILADLNIAERRVPQDGRFTIKMEGKRVDIRVSTIPTIYGENVVLRLLDVSSAMLSLDKLGFSGATLEKYNKLIMSPHGLILVTGPTGSGKTTTLYASLDKINTVEKNIVTIEDPVEYKLKGIRQIQVDAKADLTFANGLRSILRQDPNIIMVGEIRDFETAQIAVQAALTGHLVFATLHTNDAAGAVTRLIDMGIEPFLVSSSVAGILAQRLVRKICPDCKEKYAPAGETLRDIGHSGDGQSEVYKGKGCSKCLNTGYKGRISIYELLIPDNTIRNAITAKVPAEEMGKCAHAAGMTTLMDDGLDKARQGITTLEEVLRVTKSL